MNKKTKEALYLTCMCIMDIQDMVEHCSEIEESSSFKNLFEEFEETCCDLYCLTISTQNRISKRRLTNTEIQKYQNNKKEFLFFLSTKLQAHIDTLRLVYKQESDSYEHLPDNLKEFSDLGQDKLFDLEDVEDIIERLTKISNTLLCL